MPERLRASSLQHFKGGALVLSAPAGVTQSTDTTAHGSWGAPSALLAGEKGGGKEGAGLTWVRQGRKWLRGTAGSGTACQEHLQETQPASPPAAVLQGLLIPASAAWEGRLEGDTTVSCLSPAPSASSAPAPQMLLAEPWSACSPFSRSWGGQPHSPPPRPLAFAERVRDRRFPAVTKERGGLVRTEVAGSRMNPGGRGVPYSPVFTRKRGGGGWTEGVKFPQLKCNHRYRLALHASPLLAPSPCVHRWGFSAA